MPTYILILILIRISFYFIVIVIIYIIGETNAFLFAFHNFIMVLIVTKCVSKNDVNILFII